MCFAPVCISSGISLRPAHAAEPKQPPVADPKNDQKPKNRKDGPDDSDRYQADKFVPDPLDKTGPKISKSLADLHEEHNNRSGNDFNRAQTDIHRDKKTAGEIDAYRILRNRRNRVDAKLKTMEEDFSGRLKTASRDMASLKKQLEGIKETPENPKGKQVQKAIEKTLKNDKGDLNKAAKKKLANLRTLINWINRLTAIRTTLNDMIKLLEDTGAPNRNVSQGGKKPVKTKRVCKRSGLLGAMNCVTIQMDNLQ
jgi:hypothetical protein